MMPKDWEELLQAQQSKVGYLEMAIERIDRMLRVEEENLRRYSKLQSRAGGEMVTVLLQLLISASRGHAKLLHTVKEILEAIYAEHSEHRRLLQATQSEGSLED